MSQQSDWVQVASGQVVFSISRNLSAKSMMTWLFPGTYVPRIARFG